MAQPTEAGVPTVLLGYVRDQLSRGWPVSVACPPGPGWLAAAANDAGARVLPWPATRSPGPATVGETRNLARLIATAEPQLVHLHSSKAGLAGRLAIRGRRPTVFQPHAWSFLAAGGPLHAASIRWERSATRWTDVLVCVSDAERRAGAAAGVLAATAVIPNGIDCEPIRPAGPAERAAARVQLGLPPGPLAVCVGRLCPQKGQRDLVAAWPAVRREVADARLVLVGDGPDRRALEAAARGREPGITLVGERADVPTWLAAADVVVVASRWEAMPLVALEAMASARSVVATDAAGLAESVPAGGGAIVACGDRDALAARIAERLRDPARADAEGAAGRRHTERQHRAETAAAALAELYAQVLQRRTGREPVRQTTGGSP